MGVIFQNDLQDALTFTCGYIPYGGADFGEVLAVARTVGDGDAGAFNKAWIDAGDRIVQRARTALGAGKRTSARDAFLRASCHYASSYRPLFGRPVDARLLAGFRKQISAFNDGLALFDPPVTPLWIPFEDRLLPAYFLPARDRANEMRPLMILTNGYDGTVTDMYFASAVAASQRGYHSLFFDGPGQGELLFEHEVRMRPDWESVIARVVDFALQIEPVDATRIALMGWSFGGYLAARAASGEHRLAACVVDPGLMGGADQFRQHFANMGATPESVKDLERVDSSILEQFETAVNANDHMYWTIVRRAFWVHGVNSVREYLRAVAPYTMAGRIGSIRCPTLVTLAESDPLASTAQAFYDALECPKTLVRFTDVEGAGMHVETYNRSLLNTRVYDWLDDLFA